MKLTKPQLQPWLKPPTIGKQKMPDKYWEITRHASAIYKVDPLLVSAYMCIESRFDPYLYGRRNQVFGLMGLQKDVAKKYGVTDPFNPTQNIWAGTKIISEHYRKYDGNLKRMLKRYNPEDNGTYSRAVIAAYHEAKRSTQQ